MTSTDRTYTGQRDITGTGLMDYKARFYSPTLGRFTQPDSIIPGATNPQSWNRYSYVGNNPILYSDPTGHMRIQDGPQQDQFSQWKADQYVPKPKPQNNSGGGGEQEDNKGSDNSGIDTGLQIEFGLGVRNVVDWVQNLGLKEFDQYTRIYGPSWAKESLGIPGTRYLTSNVTSYQVNSLIKSAKNSGSSSFLLSLFANTIDYRHGKFANTQEFAVSVAVDTALSYAVGVTATLAVATALSVAGVAAAPVLAVGVATIGVGLLIGWGLNKLGVPDMLKSDVNGFINSLKE